MSYYLRLTIEDEEGRTLEGDAAEYDSQAEAEAVYQQTLAMLVEQDRDR